MWIGKGGDGSGLRCEGELGGKFRGVEYKLGGEMVVKRIRGENGWFVLRWGGLMKGWVDLVLKNLWV